MSAAATAPNGAQSASGTATPNSGHAAKAPLPPVDKAGHHGNYNEEQRATLSHFEQQLTDESALSATLLDDAEQRDIVLGRFLRARDWNIENAKKMYNDTLAWRKEVDIDQLMKPASEGGYDFVERHQVAELGWKMYFHGTDRYHRPIFVQDLSNIDINRVFEVTTADRIVRFFACNLEDAVQHKYRVCTDVARAEACANGATDEEVARIIIDDNFMILNIAGLGMGTFWSFKTRLQQLLAILDANYPELSGRVQIVNAPWLFSTIWAYIKPWLPVNTAAKIDIAGADFDRSLLPFIDSDQLPTALGGQCSCDEKGGCAFSNKGPWQRERQSSSSAKVTNDVGSNVPEEQIAAAGV